MQATEYQFHFTNMLHDTVKMMTENRADEEMRILVDKPLTHVLLSLQHNHKGKDYVFQGQMCQFCSSRTISDPYTETCKPVKLSAT